MLWPGNKTREPIPEFEPMELRVIKISFFLVGFKEVTWRIGTDFAVGLGGMLRGFRAYRVRVILGLKMQVLSRFGFAASGFSQILGLRLWV